MKNTKNTKSEIEKELKSKMRTLSMLKKGDPDYPLILFMSMIVIIFLFGYILMTNEKVREEFKSIMSFDWISKTDSEYLDFSKEGPSFLNKTYYIFNKDVCEWNGECINNSYCLICEGVKNS
jgi:hypothetical protein